MKFINNVRYKKNKIVNHENGDSDCLTIYSKRAAEFDECDFNKSLREVYKQAWERDDFGIVSLQHGLFEFVVEYTNFGYSIRAFYNNTPNYLLDKIGYGYSIGDLLT